MDFDVHFIKIKQNKFPQQLFIFFIVCIQYNVLVTFHYIDTI